MQFMKVSSKSIYIDRGYEKKKKSKIEIFFQTNKTTTEKTVSGALQIFCTNRTQSSTFIYVCILYTYRVIQNLISLSYSLYLFIYVLISIYYFDGAHDFLWRNFMQSNIKFYYD